MTQSADLPHIRTQSGQLLCIPAGPPPTSHRAHKSVPIQHSLRLVGGDTVCAACKQAASNLINER